MADTITLSVTPRDGAGRGPARAVRRAGRVPGVLYGEGKPPTLISVDPRELTREFVKPGFFARLIEVELEGSKHRALPREVQVDPVTDRPVHVDFMRVGSGTKITVAVPVRFINAENSPGIKRGGILNVVRHAIDMVCPVDAIPEHITIALDDLEIGDSVHISKVKLPEGVRPVISRDFTIASIASPTAVREEAAAAAAAAAAAVAAAAAAAEAGTPAEGEAGAAPGAAPGATPGAAPGAAAGAAPGAAPKGGAPGAAAGAAPKGGAPGAAAAKAPAGGAPPKK
jgi:large subunit ribosomal protein L25